MADKAVRDLAAQELLDDQADGERVKKALDESDLDRVSAVFDPEIAGRLLKIASRCTSGTVTVRGPVGVNLERRAGFAVGESDFN